MPSPLHQNEFEISLAPPVVLRDRFVVETRPLVVQGKEGATRLPAFCHPALSAQCFPRERDYKHSFCAAIVFKFSLASIAYLRLGHCQSVSRFDGRGDSSERTSKKAETRHLPAPLASQPIDQRHEYDFGHIKSADEQWSSSVGLPRSPTW